MATAVLVWKDGRRTTAELADAEPPAVLRLPANAGTVTLQTDQTGPVTRSRQGTAVFRFSDTFDDGGCPIYLYEHTELV